MSKVAVLLGAGEPYYSSPKSLARAFRELGHDVTTIGPGYFDRYEADILLPDRKHVEYYSYTEVLEKLLWMPDLLLNIEPHAFLTGQKPPELISAFLATDAHRAGELYHRVLKQGNYDLFFCSQPYFMSLFGDIPNLSVEYLPVGFDTNRFSFPEVQPECDMAFVGQSGIADLIYDHEDEIGRYTNSPPSTQGYAFGPPSYDYAHRAELLMRLMRHLDVRIYEPLYDDRYQLAIQKGALGFHCSILHDIALRVMETCAAGRLLIADKVPGIDGILQDGVHCRYYSLHYAPFYPNFNLDYAQVYRLFSYYLSHNTEREKIAKNGKEKVWRWDKWTDRAQSILDCLWGE